MNLTGEQLQYLQDRFNVKADLEDGTIVLRRRDYRPLKKDTVAKMLGIEVQPQWTEKYGKVRNV